MVTVRRMDLTRLALGLLLLLPTGHVLAQIQTDGTMGPVTSASGNVVIPNTLGTQAGGNLFHSFSVFNIREGESALFTSSFAGVTSNVIGRVTGGTRSAIDGVLRCDIPGANLWLINPNGIAFGKNASVDVQGSFRASTADYLVFEDGKRWSASPGLMSDPILSTANPAAFGFLSSTPAPITMDSGFIQTGQNGRLSLVGGNLDIAGATLYAPGGRVDLISVGSPGEARLTASGQIDVDSFAQRGDISISNGAFITAGDLVNAAGSLYIRAGHFLLDASAIFNPTGAQDGGNIDIGITGEAVLKNGSQVGTATASGGSAGALLITAGGDFKVLDGASVSSTTSGGSGNAGNIAISAQNVEIAHGARISTTTESSASGHAGDIAVAAAETISIIGDPKDFTTGIASNSFQSLGDAGNLNVTAKTLMMSGGTINSENPLSAGAAGGISIAVSNMELSGGALISADSLGSGPGGNVNVAASDSASLIQDSSVQASSGSSGPGGSVSIATPRLTLDQSSVSTAAFASGNAGNIDIRVDRLDVVSGSITSDASLDASGAAGAIFISAIDEISMKNSGTALDRPGISSSNFGDGNAGSITINTGKLTLNDAVIDTLALGGKGSAGTITVNVNELVLQNGGSMASDVGENASGRGGSIEINASQSVLIQGESPTLTGFNSGISTGTLGAGPGGRIALNTPNLSIDGGTITASTAIGSGDAGSITIQAGELSLTRHGNIQVATFGSGHGGHLQVTADKITIDGTASGTFRTGISSQAQGSGAGGDVEIDARDLEIRSGGLVTAKSTGGGQAGNLRLNVADNLTLTDSSILTSAELSSGGNIDLHVGRRLFLQNSTITSSANGVTPTDNGGNLTIARPQFLILNNSEILARANAGNGGNITLGAEFFFQSADSILNASSNRGLDGRIVIDSPHQVTGTINALELPALDVSELLRQHCAAAAYEGRSSFTVEGQSGVPARPGDFLSSPVLRPAAKTPNGSTVTQ